MAIGTFGAFTQARLAIYAAQTGISVTGNNISNINTPGYTRQRLNQVSLYAAGSDRYYAEGDVRTGQGALVKSISQIRNPYLDIRYREANAKVGFNDARLEGLKSIATVLDEVGLGDASKGEDGFGILGLDIMDLYKTLQNITDQTGQQEYDDSVRAVAKNLVDKLHRYANQLEQVRKDTISDFEQDVDSVNLLLKEIQGLNEEIRKCEIHGDPALELRDSRNNKLDELSGLIDIDVTYSEEIITGGLSVEKITVRLGNANPDGGVTTDEALLIDGIYAAQLSLKTPEMNPARLKDGYDTTLKPGDAGYEPLYVSKDGTGTTDDIREAKMLTGEDNKNYDFTVSTLKNSIGELHKIINKGPTVAANAGDAVMDKDGNVTGTVAGLFTGSAKSVSVTLEDQPEKGDTTIEIYTKGKDKNGNDIYTKQVVQQIVSKPVALDDNDLGGEIQAERELLTEEGVFIDQNVIKGIDENAATKRGIGYYQKVLDLLANQLATALNEANQGFLMDDETGNYICEDPANAGKAIPLTINGETLNKDWEKTDPTLRTNILNTVGLNTVTSEDDLKKIGLTWKKVADAYLKGQTWTPNAANTGGKFEPENKEDILDSNGNVVTPGWGGNANADAIFIGAPLFSNANNSDDVMNITASNINISYTWSHTSALVRSFNCPPGDLEPASGQSDNLVHLKYLVGEEKFDFTPNQLDSSPNASSKPVFSGTFYQMWNNIGGTLGEDQSEAGDSLDFYYQTALSIDTDRDSVSSVDFNDEAMNLMMYAKSYNAACRLMTTIDTVLDKLINNTGVTT